MESLRRMSIKRVASMIKSFEDAFRQKKSGAHEIESAEEGSTQHERPKRRWKMKAVTRNCKHWLKTSRFSGIPFSLIYGAFIYLYITYMIFPGDQNEEISSLRKRLNTTSKACSFEKTNNIKFNMSNPLSAAALLQEETTNATKENGHHMDINDGSKLNNSDVIVIVSVGLTITLASISVYSKHARCIMVLVLPGIITGRGRAFIMTAIMGLLIEGPVNSINYNLNQVVESNACMYQSMRNMACSYTSQMQRTMKYMVAVVKENQREMLNDLREASGQVRYLTGKAKEEIQQRKEVLSKRLGKLKSDMESLREFLGNVNKPCQWKDSALGSVEGFFNDVFGEIGSWFSKRKRRDVDICGATVPFPDIVITPNLDLESLKELNDWVKDLVPDFKMVSPNLPDLEKLVKTPSVVDIREKILNTVSDVFAVIKQYLQTLKKCFVVISMLFLIFLSYRYLQNYYSDDSFDNMFIDSNIRNLWRNSNFNKLTPLRHWELNARYQVSASPKLSKQELKRIFMKTLPTILVSIAVLFILLGDYALAELLSTLAVNGKFAVSFEGMDQGKILADALQAASTTQQNVTKQLDMTSLKLEKINLSTDPCLPRPIFTSRRKTIIIIVLLLTIAVSCFFDAYVTRIRAQICNLFYEDHARERGEYLYEKLQSGRNIRRLRLRMIVSKELKRREKLVEFSWIAKVFSSFRNKQKQHQLNCPACLWIVKMEETKLIKIEETKIPLQTRICNDCALDF